MIRDFALSLASSHYYGDCGKSNVFVHLNSGPEEWSRASRVCLVDNDNQLNDLPTSGAHLPQPSDLVSTKQ